MEGTYELPVAQRDRFQFKITVGMLEENAELALLDRFDDDPGLGPDDVSQVVTVEDLVAAREVVDEIHVDSAVKRYLRNVVAGTRERSDVEHGASPRAALSFLDATKARAAIRGRKYVIPDDVKALASPVLAHRLVPSVEAELSDVSTADMVEAVLDSVTVPEGIDAGGESMTVNAEDGGASSS
jgi:MoxR-like ATPase